MNKKIVSLFITGIIFVGIMAGCGASSEPQSSSSGDVTSDVSTGDNNSSDLSGKIVVGGWPSGEDAFKAALEGFNEEYPNIEVEFQFTDGTSHHQALQTALAANSGAQDVAMVEGAYIAQYRDSSALVNLYNSPYNAEGLKDDFVSYKWEQAISSDKTKLVAIPWDIGPCSYFYRTDIFEECGLPTDPVEVAELMSTWDGVLEVAEKVYIEGNRWLLTDASYLYQSLFCNRDFYNENLELQIERDGDLECLEAVITMRENKWDMNVDMWSNEANAAFSDGSLVSVATGAWFGGFLKTDIAPDESGNWGVTTLPGSMKSSNWGGSFLVIPEQGKNKEAAWAFVEYMLANSVAQNEMFEAVDYYPAYEPAWEDASIYDEEDPYFGGQQTKKLWAEIAADLQPVYTTIMDTTAEGYIYSSVNAGLKQGLSAEEIRALLKSDIEKATVELKQQQIQALKTAGVWEE